MRLRYIISVIRDATGRAQLCREQCDISRRHRPPKSCWLRKGEQLCRERCETSSEVSLRAKRAASIKRAASAPAEGPAYGLDLARRCGFPLRALQPTKWHVYGGGTFGAA